MNRVLKSIFLQLIFWLFFFDLGRLILLIYHASLFHDSGTELLGAFFYYNILLDISSASYLISIPLLLMLLQLFKPKKFIDTFNLWFSCIFIVLISFIIIAEIGIFAEWKTKLSFKALTYLSNPSEIYYSAGALQFFGLFIILLVFAVGSVLFFRKFIHMKAFEFNVKLSFKLTLCVVLPIFLFLGIRGSIKPIPISQSQSYFSNNNAINLLSVNPFWNFMYSISQNRASLDKNPFIFYNPAEAKSIVTKINSLPADSSTSIFTCSKPNIVMVILEGWSADLITELGAKPGITPNFDTLIKNGLFFTQIYSPGSRSEQGMSSLFSSFPAQPLTTIAHIPEKFVKLPSFPKLLSENGYNNSYYFGGQLIYGNMRSYIYFNDFKKIIELNDFSSDIPTGKLGVHDEFLYPRVLNEINMEKEPFFASLFTMSTHSPYDWPNKRDILKYGDPERDYINSAYYADSCLASFVKKCSKQKWYNKTVFVFVSDHGHSSNIFRNVYDPGYQHIPLLIYGNALKKEYKGVKNKTIGSQVDLAATLLAQLGIKHDSFKWSKNLLNKSNPEFAFISFEVGFTWVCKNGYFVYDHNQKKIIGNTIPVQMQDSIVKTGKAYLQQVYQDYWDY